MKTWWQRRSLRARLALGHAVAAMAISLACLLLTTLLGTWKPISLQGILAGFILSLLAALLFGASSYFIAGRALRPLHDVTNRMQNLSIETLNERLPAGDSPVEIEQLKIALNGMLQQLEDSFAQLDRLIADASHELRTPLTAMRAVGEVALREANPAILHDAVASMLEEIRRMKQLIDRLLLLTRPGNDAMPVRLEAGPVRPALLEISESMSLVAEEKQQRLEVICPDHLVAVFDPALLRLVLINLVQNAIRYSPAGKPIYMRAMNGNNEVVVEVVDEGPGIAREHQQKIFERFYRVDQARTRSEGGGGLGLAIVKWAMERMGGSVELTSAPQRGAVFSLRLQAARS